MDTALLIADLNRVYGWELAEDALETQLAEKINVLIQHDFGALVELLYRIDVPEQKLRRMLDDNSGEDAGRLIARLIMERQWQKIESRRRYQRDAGDGADDADEQADAGVERW